MHVNEIAHYLWKSFNLNLLLNIQVLWRASVSMNNCDVLIFLRISCFLMRCLWVNLIFQMSILLTSSCWKKGSHWDDRGKRRKNKEKRFKRLKKVHQRRKFVPFVNFLKLLWITIQYKYHKCELNYVLLVSTSNMEVHMPAWVILNLEESNGI